MITTCNFLRKGSGHARYCNHPAILLLPKLRSSFREPSDSSVLDAVWQVVFAALEIPQCRGIPDDKILAAMTQSIQKHVAQLKFTGLIGVEHVSSRSVGRQEGK